MARIDYTLDRAMILPVPGNGRAAPDGQALTKGNDAVAKMLQWQDDRYIESMRPLPDAIAFAQFVA